MDFAKYPNIKVNDDILTDITKRVDIIDSIKNNLSLYSFRIVRDGQRPEDIALEEYGDENLYWIILFANNITNIYNQWLKTDEELFEYVSEKYGTDGIYSTHHREDSGGNWINSGGVEITNLTFEERINEESRNIKILKQEYVPKIIKEFQEKINE